MFVLCPHCNKEIYITINDDKELESLAVFNIDEALKKALQDKGIEFGKEGGEKS